MELLATGFNWLPGFSKINATCYCIVESYSIMNETTVISKVKFKLTTPPLMIIIIANQGNL